MDGLDRATLGVRLKLGQKLQGEKFDTSKIPILVKLQVSHTALYGLVTSSRRLLTTKSVYINSVNMVRLFNVVSDAILYIYPYGTKSAGREKVL